ncbi:MAG: VOC family protein [Acidobacteriia bacterium]|nr:VOC family protein [Terriglobia bacterium]
MIPIHALFEGHLTVSDLPRAMAFYGEALGLELAQFFPEQRVAFYWIGGRGTSMLGLWEVGTLPLRQSLHLAFRVSLDDLLRAAQELRKAAIAPLDFEGNPAENPVVLAWMPAASLYFHDPDGNLLEFLAMLEGEPKPEMGVVSWEQWIAV